MKKSLVALGVVVVAAACAAQDDPTDVVARVDDYVFAVDDAVDLLADEERLAADAGVVRSLADLWIDYTLLAHAAARDTMFPGLDMEPLVMRQVDQVMVFQLRDSMIQVDTFVTDDELRQRYEAEAPAVEMRARHIMFQLPVEATTAQRDSVAEALGVVRERIMAGSDFATIARQVSQDPGTSSLGGDLGFFGRGQLVAPFEEAVFALEPGEVSDVVETPMGLHLIRLEERRVQNFEQIAASYRTQVQGRMLAEAESVFVAGLVDRVGPVPVDEAAEIVREIADNPGARLAGRAGRRPLVEWDGGALSVADFQQVMRLEAPQLRQQLFVSSDEEIDAFLRGLARRDLLIEAAVSNGLRPPADSIARLVSDAKVQLRSATRMLGLLSLDRAPGEDLDIAVARAVKEALEGNLTGATQVVPLGLVGFQLRDGRSITLQETGIGQVILEVARIRSTRSLSPIEQTLGSEPSAADTTGR